MRMRNCFGLVLLPAMLMGSSCQTVRTKELIQRYHDAECVPVRLASEISGFPRAWDVTIKTHEGTAIHVSGARIPGGRITVKYLSDEKEMVAADAGDYIYPSDIRFDRPNDLLYVKTSGRPAAFGGPQTWLFEYDLDHRRQTHRSRVEPTSLPEECPVSDSK